MVSKENMTCIICPMGCSMEVTIEEENGVKKVVSVAENGCPRGPVYAGKEIQNPTRTLTTTIAVTGGDLKLVPVKTLGEVPVRMLMPCMEVIKRVVCEAPVETGQILVRDILGTGVDVVACADVLRKY